MIIEWNMFGAELKSRLETVFPRRNNFDEEVMVKFKHRIDARTKKFGLKIKKDNKPIICQNFKKYAGQNRISVCEKRTVKEAGTFGKVGSSWEGQMGHDDLIMTCITASEFFATVDFSEFVEELYDLIPDQIRNKIDEILEKDSDGGNLNYDIYDLI